MKKLKLGVIGIGRIAHAHIAAACELAGETKLVAFSSRNLAKAREAAERYGVKTLYGDYQALLSDPEVEAVVICLPQDLHHRACLAAAAAGKHILVEKPMTLTAAEAEEVVEAARSGGVGLMVGQSRRFPAAVQELVRRLPSIGKIVRLHILFLVSFPAPPAEWWRSSERAGGLVIMLQGSHALDSALWWLGAAPSSVFATASRRNPAWEGEDEADILCSFSDGAVASVHLSLGTTPPLHESLVVGERGHLRLIEEPLGTPFGFRYRLEHDGETVFEEPVSQLYVDQLREFSASIREGRPALAAGEEILPLMRTLEAVRRSAREGRPVAP